MRMCDAFGVPLVVLGGRARLPAGGRPGVGRRGPPGAPSCCTRSPRSTVPRVTLVTRKSYGGAYIAMNSRALGVDQGLRLAGRGDLGDGRGRGRAESCTGGPWPPRPPGGAGTSWEAQLAAEHERESWRCWCGPLEIGVIDEVIEACEDQAGRSASGDRRRRQPRRGPPRQHPAIGIDLAGTARLLAWALIGLRSNAPLLPRPSAIFEVLCDPQGHVAIDSSGMLQLVGDGESWSCAVGDTLRGAHGPRGAERLSRSASTT